MCNKMHRTFRGFAAICGATLAVGGAAALSNSAFAQAPATPATPAAPAAPAAPASTPWTFQGLFDAYYLYDGNSPKGVGTSQITGFDYNEKGSTPTLSLAELNIAKAAPAAGGFGFKTTLIAGETDSLNNPGGNESRYQDVQQLYITLAAASGAGIDVGKFYTPFGYEVVESNANINYSRSFIFSYLLPVYHTGIRAYTQSYKGLVATGYIVKSISNFDLGSGDAEGVYDQNKSYGYIGQLNYTAPSGKWAIIETYGGSHDGPNGQQDKLLLSDTDLTITPDALDTFGLNYTNRQDKVQVPGSSTATVADVATPGSDVSAHATGYAAYYQRQLAGPYKVGFRGEEINTKSLGQSPRIDSLTATLSDQATKTLLLRLEYRHDDVKTTSFDPYGFPSFVSGNNAAGSAVQNTVSASAVFTFGP